MPLQDAETLLPDRKVQAPLTVEAPTSRVTRVSSFEWRMVCRLASKPGRLLHRCGTRFDVSWVCPACRRGGGAGEAVSTKERAKNIRSAHMRSVGVKVVDHGKRCTTLRCFYCGLVTMSNSAKHSALEPRCLMLRESPPPRTSFRDMEMFSLKRLLSS
jgi:hypothetical protein